MSWNFMNKVSSVTSPNGTVTYAYNPMGQRIGKVFAKLDKSAKIDLYSRDAQGNTLAIYETERYCEGWKSLPPSGTPCKLITDPLVLSKLYIYGSSRLGELTVSPDKQMFRDTVIGFFQFWNKPGAPIIRYRTGYRYTHRAGTRRYELTNHLGNVLATVSDRKLVETGVTKTRQVKIDWYDPNVEQLYPCTYNLADFPGLVLEPCRVVWLGGGRIPVEQCPCPRWEETVVAAPAGFFPFFEPDVLTATDYYPFGMEMPGRKYNPQGYRYGFNGKENDRSGEWGLGLVQDYEARIYSPALGKWLSTDPLEAKYPMYSPYVGMGDNPMVFIDADGKEIIIAGSPEFKAKAFEAVQALTNDKLIMLESGKVILEINQTKNDVVALTGNPIDKATMDLKNGTELVSTLIGHEKKVTIQYNIDNNAHPVNLKDSYLKSDGTGSGSDSWVGFNPDYCGDYIPNVEDCEETGRPTYIGLVHELFHAKNQIKGIVDPTCIRIKFGNAQGVMALEEVSARQFEQLVRAEHKICLRELETLPNGTNPACEVKTRMMLESSRNSRNKGLPEDRKDRSPVVIPQKNQGVKECN